MKAVHPKRTYGMAVSACLWLGLFPLLQRGTYSRLTYDKWTIMLILTGVTALSFLIDLLLARFIRPGTSASASLAGAEEPAEGPSRTNRFRSRFGRYIPLILAGSLFLWTVLSCLFSSYGPGFWLRGEAVRYEGLISQLCYFILFTCFFLSDIRLKPVLFAAAAGAVAFLVIVLLQRSGGNPLGLYPSGRSYALNPEFQGTIGNIDMGVGYLLLLAGLFLYEILHCLFTSVPSGMSFRLKPKADRIKLSDAAVLVSSCIALLVTLYLIITMGVQFGVIALAMLFLFTLLRFLPRKWRLPLLLFLMILVLLVVWFWPGQSGGIWELHEILHGRGRLSFGSNRVAVWLYSLRLAREAPLLGGGSGTFDSRFNQYISDCDLVIPTEQDGLPLPHYFDNPHNEYIAQLTDHGLPALVLFLALLLYAVFRRRDAWFPLLAPCSAAVFCYAVQAFFSFSVCIVAPMFWVLLGLSFKEQAE